MIFTESNILSLTGTVGTVARSDDYGFVGVTTVTTVKFYRDAEVDRGHRCPLGLSETQVNTEISLLFQIIWI